MACPPGNPQSMARLRVLLTGFGPFPGVPDNPSARLAETLAATSSALDCDLHWQVLPTEWETVAALVPALHETLQPHVMIHFGLSERSKHKPRELSGGQEQRVGIARAIVSDPTLLLCDEPTGDLDRKSGDEILDLLQALNERHGKTIIMVTHDPHAAARAKHTLHLTKGQLGQEAAA